MSISKKRISLLLFVAVLCTEYLFSNGSSAVKEPDDVKESEKKSISTMPKKATADLPKKSTADFFRNIPRESLEKQSDPQHSTFHKEITWIYNDGKPILLESH